MAKKGTTLTEDLMQEVERWAKMEKTGLSQATGRKEAALLASAWVVMYTRGRGEEPSTSAFDAYLDRLKESYDRMYGLCADGKVGERYLAGSVEVVHMKRYFVRDRS